jgi:IS605 OrfB family transposase
MLPSHEKDSAQNTPYITYCSSLFSLAELLTMVIPLFIIFSLIFIGYFKRTWLKQNKTPQNREHPNNNKIDKYVSNSQPSQLKQGSSFKSNSKKNVFVARTADHIITRKFGLLPVKESAKGQYKFDPLQMPLITAAFKHSRRLANGMVDVLFGEAVASSQVGQLVIDRFEGTTKTSLKKNIYDPYRFNRLDRTFKVGSKVFELNERVARFVLDQAVFSVRNSMLQRHDLENIIETTKDILQDEQHDARHNILYHLLSGVPLRYSTPSLTTGAKVSLFSFYSQALQQDVFGRLQDISLHFFNTRFSQLRNLLLKCPSINPYFRRQLKALRQEPTIPDLRPVFRETVKDVLKEPEPVLNDTLDAVLQSLLTRFFATAKRRMTPVAKNKLQKEDEIESWDEKGNFEKKRQLLDRLKRIEGLGGLHEITYNLVYSNIAEFKEVRDKELDLLKESISKQLATTPPFRDLENALEGIMQETIAALLQNPKHILAKQIFKPSRSYLKITGMTFDDFTSFVKKYLGNKIRRHLRMLFYGKAKLFDLLVDELKNVKVSLNKQLKKPEIKGMSLSYIKERYELLPGEVFKISLVNREEILLKINAPQGRLQQTINEFNAYGYDVTRGNPLFQFKRGKIILNQPFELRKELNERAAFQPDPKVEMGIDEGLIDFATVSVGEHVNVDGTERMEEFARYFLNQRNVFDMEFRAGNDHRKRGKFKLRPEVKKRAFQKGGERHLKFINLKQKLVQIRAEKRKLQSEIQKIMNKHPRDSERKSRFRFLRRQLDRLEDRIQNINTEIVHQVSSKIVQIARHHRSARIKFEDLKWARHSKKYSVGHYLGFWQVHWFYSKVIEAVKVRAQLLGIEVKLVKAAGTSKECPFHGSREDASRTGKFFKCSHPKCSHGQNGYKVDADLNAARNILMRGNDNQQFFVRSIGSVGGSR